MGEVLKRIAVNGEVLNGVPFIVDTKLRYNPPNSHSSEMVEMSVKGSLEALMMSKVNIEYLHGIDETSDKRETCRAMEKAFTEDKFELFGICNASAKQLEEFMSACKDQGLVIRPNVYQGNYSVLSRECEENGVLDKVREYGMPFYAYSPAGGGIFNTKAYRERKNGRFDSNSQAGKSWQGRWYDDRLLRAAEKIRDVGEANGLSGHSLSLRWAVWHSNLSGQHHDGIILGASSIDQLNSNLDAIESGPLPDDMLKAVKDIWKEAKL